MELRDIVAAFMRDHNLSQREFARVCGVSNSSISLLLKGSNPKTGEPIKQTIDTLKKLAAGMCMSFHELALIADDIDIDLSGDALPSNIQSMPSFRKVPRLGAIACGDPILAEENLDGYDDVPDYIAADFTLVCHGDSMIGARIYDGDIVCLRQQPTVPSGSIAAVLIDDEATLKRVLIYPDHVVLQPENPNHKPRSFWDEDMNRVRILGLATHFISAVR